MKKPHGRRVLVTGATSGIGLVAVERFVELGWEVFATTRRPEVPRELKDILEGAGDRGHVVTLDVDRPESIAACAAEVLQRSDGYGVDVVINNAGFARMSPIVDLTDEDLRGHFETNVFGVMSVTRAFLPRMIQRGHGRIVNVSSSGGRMSLPFVGAYHAAKFAVEALSDAMRWELEPLGIHVSVIEPGPVRTKFADHLLESTRLLPESSPYRPLMSEVDRIQALAQRHMIDPRVVVRDIVHAASARKPRARYVEPRLLSVVIALANLAPTCILDPIVRTMFGLRKLRPATSATAS